MYKKIDKWVYDLEMNYVSRELKWWDMNATIVENLQHIDDMYGLRNCFEEEFSGQEITQIANDQNGNAILFEKLKNCVDNESLPISTFTQYQSLIQKYYQDTLVKSESKADTVQKIATVWLYSDGIEENSPFDLLVDLANINRIIFEEEFKYEWYNNFDISKYLDDSFDGTLFDGPRNYSFPSTLWNNSFWETFLSWSQNSPENIGPIFQPIEISDGNMFACNINDSGLSDETFQLLTSNAGHNNSGNTWNNWNIPVSEFNDERWQNQKQATLPDDFFHWDEYATNYSKINDNAFWPCSNFFCITVENIIYKQNLLKGRNTIAIETLINRSNEHIYKFVNSSLVPSAMTTNNFELGFQGLNLADIFHVGIQVTTKPVPFLNVNKDDSKKWRDETEFAAKNLLTKYYSNIGLDYNRANDISLFTSEENTLKTLLSSTELPVSHTTQSQEELQNYQRNLARQNDFLSHSIDKKIAEDDMQEFQAQFTELQQFTQNLLEYSKNLQALAKKLNEKPKQ